MKAIGLMSGTSLDGIDAAAVEIEKRNGRYSARLESFLCLAWDEALRERLLAACEDRASTSEVARLDIEVGRAFAQAAQQVLVAAHWREQDVEIIGSHGQTIFHAGDEGVTLQIGDISTIAALSGIACAGNFRTSDMALGGQGAPLTPWADWHLLSSAQTPRIVHNIGGMANFAWLPRGGELRDVRAWDSGPGCAILNECASWASGGGSSIDWEGDMANRGRVRESWLAAWKAHPFFEREPPKSCGREEFGRGFGEKMYRDGVRDGLTGVDVMANATSLVAWSMARAYAQLGPKIGALQVLVPETEVILCGGGAFNTTLRLFLSQEIQAQIGLSWPVRMLEEIGGNSEAREAIAFAMMACAALEGEANTLPQVTGASRACAAGQIARP